MDSKKKLVIVDEPQKLSIKVQHNVMNEKSLKEHCRQNDLYMTPYLNDVLYLHHKGFTKIENLDEYTGLKSLWLENNSIKIIENLGHLTNLRCLFLQNNKIEEIKNIENLQNLSNLNLASNFLTSLNLVSILSNLHTLDVSRNKLKYASDIAELAECPALSVLDVSFNCLEELGTIDILSRIDNLRVLTLMGNPVARKTKHYRRIVIKACEGLTYFDQRPVTDKERQCISVWMEGGAEAERTLKESWAKQEHDRMAESVKRLVKIRDANLRKRGIDPDDDEAQLEAVKNHGKELMEKYKEELRSRQGNGEPCLHQFRDASVLDPLETSINLFVENQRLAVPDLENEKFNMAEGGDNIKEMIENAIDSAQQDSKPRSEESSINELTLIRDDENGQEQPIEEVEETHLDQLKDPELNHLKGCHDEESKETYWTNEVPNDINDDNITGLDDISLEISTPTPKKINREFLEVGVEGPNDWRSTTRSPEISLTAEMRRLCDGKEKIQSVKKKKPLIEEI